MVGRGLGPQLPRLFLPVVALRWVIGARGVVVGRCGVGVLTHPGLDVPALSRPRATPWVLVMLL